MLNHGCQRRIIQLKNTGSPIFDEAYFILKENNRCAAMGRDEMIKEADRIISENLLAPHPVKKLKENSLGGLIWFLAGAAVGAVILILFF